MGPYYYSVIMNRPTLRITPMNNGNMVTTYVNDRKPRTSKVVFGKYGEQGYTWEKPLVVEVVYNEEKPCIANYLKNFFTDMGVRGVDMTNVEVDDNGDYYEVVAVGEHKNVHIWMEVEEI